MTEMGISTFQAAIVAGFVLLLLVPGTIALLKGHYLLFAAGFLLAGGLVWWIVALRLARPASWWARRFYSPDKLKRATQRYGLSSA